LFNQVRASQEEQQEGTAGLKVFVDIYHNRRGSAQLCVSSTYEDLGCKTINLSQYPSPVQSDQALGHLAQKWFKLVRHLEYVSLI
jgi:hypothetical protein